MHTVHRRDSTLCDRARYLLANDMASPTDQIGLLDDGGRVLLTASVGWAAKHMATEGSRDGPRWAKWRPNPFSRGDVAA